MIKYENNKTYESNLGNITITFRPWTAKEEKEYLKFIENLDNEAYSTDEATLTDVKIYEILIKPVISKEDQKKPLSILQQRKLLIDIRLKSISEYVEDNVTCSFCKKEYEIKTKINDIMNYTPSKFSIIEVEDIKIELSDITNMNEMKSLNIKKGIVDYIFDGFLLHIKKLTVQDIEYNEFTKKELKDFFDKIPSKIFDEIFSKYQDMTDILDITYHSKCPHCKKEEDIDYSYIPNLLWV